MVWYSRSDNDSQKQTVKVKQLKIKQKVLQLQKKDNYTKDSYSFTFNKRRPIEKSTKETKRTLWKKNKAEAVTARLISNNNSDVEFYLANQAFMTHKADEKRE